MSPGRTIGIDLSSREAFFRSTAWMFVPDGPGRIVVWLTPAQIVEIDKLDVDIMRRGDRWAADGAEFVVPTPAGIVAVRRAEVPAVIAELERELRPGRHDLASTEEFFAWQRDLYKPRTMADGTPLPGREVVVELRGRTLETAIYALSPLRIITPFGTLVLLREPDAGD